MRVAPTPCGEVKVVLAWNSLYTPSCPFVPSVLRTCVLQLRAVHDVSGTNLFVQSRRYGCLNPECPAVKRGCAAWLEKREKEPNTSPAAVPVVRTAKGRELTPAEVESLRTGDLSGKDPLVLAVLQNGAGFSINTRE